MDNNKIRLQKYLADAGVCSRRAGEQLIEAGRVQVNGKEAFIGQSVNPFKDKVTVDKKPVRYQNKKHTYIMMYKPRGYITTMSDDMGRKCVKDLLKGINKRVFPVGRLDKDSEGMLLFTDDGELSNTITGPQWHIPKTYRVTLNGKLEKSMVENMKKGMTLSDGQQLLPADVSLKTEDEARTVLEITIYEGKNRQIRRMCEEFGLDVKLLKREKIGELRLRHLKPGQIRFLEEDEIQYLKKSCNIAEGE